MLIVGTSSVWDALLALPPNSGAQQCGGVLLALSLLSLLKSLVLHWWWFPCPILSHTSAYTPHAYPSPCSTLFPCNILCHTSTAKTFLQIPIPSLPPKTSCCNISLRRCLFCSSPLNQSHHIPLLELSPAINRSSDPSPAVST